MAKRPKKTPRKKSALPNIGRIVVASGADRGKTVKRVSAGTILRIVGSGFGQRTVSVQILFDDIACKPFKLPFGDGELFVTAPLPPESTTTIRVQVGRRSSNRLRFLVERPRTRKGSTGFASRELFEAVDQLAGLTAAFARASTSLMDMDRTTRKTMLDAAEGLDRYRATGQRVVEMWMQWIPEQAKQKFAPLRTIEFYDEAVQISGATDQVHGVARNVFGNGGPVQQLIPGAPAALFASATAPPGIDSSVGSSSAMSSALGTIGFWLHEATKAAEGVENFLKVVKPSAEAGASAGIGVEGQGSVDSEFSPGELISGIAKLIDIVAQIFIKIEQSASTEALNLKITSIIQGLNRLEGKSDRQEKDIGTLIKQSREHGQKMDRLEAKSEGQDRKLDRLGTRLTEQDRKLDRMEAKADFLQSTTQRIDRTTLRNTEKLEVLEAKADRAEGKLDQIMVITGDTNRKVIILLGNLQRVEGKMDALQRDVTFIRNEVTTIHGHVDQLILDSMAIQNQLNGIQADLTAMQATLVNVGRGVGDLGRKLDDLENDLDALGVAVDRIADRTQRIERDVDRLVAQIP